MKASFSYRQHIIYGSLSVAVLCLALLDSQFHLSVLRIPFQMMLHPFIKVEQVLTEWKSAPVKFVHAVMSSEKMVADLQIKNAQLEVKIAEAEHALIENETLRKELEGSSSSAGVKQEGIIAHIMSTGEKTYLDKGTVAGVNTGNLVFAQGILLGRVDQSDLYFSSVVTFQQGSWQTVVKTQAGVQGLLTGNKKHVLLTQVSADKKIEIGDQLYTVGVVSEQVLPNLYVGQVTALNQNTGAPLISAQVDQQIQIEDVPLVIVKTME